MAISLTGPNAARNASIIADRLAGLSYADLSAKYDLYDGYVRAILRRAYKTGVATREQLRIAPARTICKDTFEEKVQKKILMIKARIKVTKSGCWEWQKWCNHMGYGWTTWLGRTRPVHRLLYELLNGEVDSKLVVCHKCDNPPCCNPAHMFVGSEKENMRDASNKRRWSRQRKACCKHGHEFTPENTFIKIQRGRPCRVCRECTRIKGRRDWQRKRQQRLGLTG